jgi:hypothetical protein
LLGASAQYFEYMEKSFYQLLNAHLVSDVKKTKIYTGESLVPELSGFQFEKSLGNLKSHISNSSRIDFIRR